ncbi:MAG: hypothetical protein JXA93_13890 [Anaerolineae bacterium]|nr:hypothetical protein [Anaerolineae bacterium]
MNDRNVKRRGMPDAQRVVLDFCAARGMGEPNSPIPRVVMALFYDAWTRL